ncbi:MAG: hypothetical protein M3N22_07990, partial [Acidobacteriota bacterium]|nr:hypothetical protein [Acidobacteriota bacterium]
MDAEVYDENRLRAGRLHQARVIKPPWPKCERRTSLFLIAAFAAVLINAPRVAGQANVHGTWHTVSNLVTINPIHAALMPNGKILVVSGSSNYPPQTTYKVGIWDPSSNSFAIGPNQNWDMFCNVMIVLPDGRPFIMGGNRQYDPFEGLPRTTIYDPVTGRYTDMEDMAHGRWYPTAIVLPDDRVMIFSGLNESGGTNSTVEIYKVGAGWGPEMGAQWTPPLYPRL